MRLTDSLDYARTTRNQKQQNNQTKNTKKDVREKKRNSEIKNSKKQTKQERKKEGIQNHNVQIRDFLWPDLR